MTTLAQKAPPLPEVPYRGIASFRYIDQKIFVARAEETWDLLSNVLIYRGVLLYGDSGSGKSSLVNAGLMSAAAKENLMAHRLRIQPRRGKEIKLERIPIEKDDQPPYLPSVFVEEGSAKDKELNLEISLKDFVECLEKLRVTSPSETDSSLNKEQPPPTLHPLLIFDQFEEFVTLFEEAMRGGETPEANLAQREAPKVREDILSTLVTLMEDETLPVKILFVFREEYLAKLNLLFKVCPELLDQYVRLLPPRVEEAEKIIRAPFADEELKTKFTGDVPGQRGREIPEHLAGAIAAQLQQRSESGFLNLSELQIICRTLWESPDPVKFFEEKGQKIEKVVQDYLANVLEKLGDLYDPAIALLGHMVTSSNTRNIVSEPDLNYLEKDSFTPEQIKDALDALVKRKLVRREPRNKIYFYEIASEFLVPWIQEKKRARLAKIEASKLAAEAEQKWKQAERERRILFYGTSALGVLLILAVLSAFYSYHLKNVADEARDKAVRAEAELQRQKEWSDNIARLLNHLISPDPQERLAAVKELVGLDQNAQLPPDLVPIVVAITSNDDNQEILKAAAYFYDALKAQEEINPASSGVTESILRTAEEKNTDLTSTKLAPRVYIQIASNDQRARADKIAEALRQSGFTVSAYQVVGSRAPKNNQLRYYKSDDVDLSSSTKDLANQALQKTENIDGQRWSMVELKRSSSVRPRHYELWFAGDPTPTPSPTADQKVLVKLILKDEQGQDLDSSIKARVSLEDVPYSDTTIMNSRSFYALPGKYLLFVQVPGYELYREQITLRATEIQNVPVVLKKRPEKPKALKE